MTDTDRAIYEAQLLPCPFCGHKAEIIRLGTGRQSMIIGCSECHCQLESGDVIGFSSEHWSWNVRIAIRSCQAKFVCEGESPHVCYRQKGHEGQHTFGKCQQRWEDKKEVAP